MRFISVVMLIAIFAMNGCGSASTAVRPQHIVLAPQPTSRPTQIASGARVYITVRDERPSKILGYRGYRGRSSIVASEDIAALLRESVNQGLAGLGFRVLPAPEGPVAHLVIHVLSFAYHQTVENLNGESKVRALVYRGPGQIFNRTYTQTLVASKFGTADSTAATINTALSDLISRILGDLELLEALQSTPDPATESGESTPLLISLPTLEIIEGESPAKVPADVRRTFAERFTQILPARGALARDLKIEYRFVQYNPGNRFVRSMLGSIAGSGSISVEVKYFDAAHKELAAMHAEGNTDYPFLETPIECASGCPFDLAIQKAADKIAEYVRQNFVASSE